MCGIAGFVLLKPPAVAFDPLHRLKTMVGIVRHRGPDDDGVWSDGVCGLAHARLAVIDLSPGGHQPMGSPDGRIWISYNGEIYNFMDLRHELEQIGYIFRSRSDTEVLIHGYAAWGVDMISRLRGMFALALWDRTERSLLLVRDRMGQKPLYWAKVGESFVFGSEIKAVLVWPGIGRSPNRAAINDYLSLHYVPAPDTAFEMVHKMPAAHWMRIQAGSDGDLQVGMATRYWELARVREAQPRVTLEYLSGELFEHLTEAVKLQLISDVQVGAFLSGGVDSSAIVAIMSRLGANPVKTFCAGFRNPDFDETHYARMIAQRYRTDHEELTIEPDLLTILPKLIWHYGEPFADPSMVPTYCIAELARRKVAVVLSGDGGDEAFMGYGRYAMCRVLERLSSLPRASRRVTAALARLAPKPLHNRYGRRLAALADLLTSRDPKSSQLYGLTIACFTDRQKNEGYAPEMTDFLGRSALERLDKWLDKAPTLASGANRADIHTSLPDGLMVKVDVASMAHALETRSPMLDHVFMEWAVGLPEAAKMTGGTTKAIFKKAMEPYLPKEAIFRNKMGFGCPVGDWLRTSLRQMTYDVLLSTEAVGRRIFRRDCIERLLAEHMTGLARHDNRLWALLILELWFRMWVDESPALRDSL